MTSRLQETAPAAALARAVEACSEEWSRRSGLGAPVTVRYASDDSVRLSPGGLAFTNYNAFLGAVSHGFAWPRLLSFFRSPLRSIRVVRSLLGMNAALHDDKPTETKLALLLRGGLAAAEAYARLDAACTEAVARETPGLVSFSVDGMNASAWFRIEEREDGRRFLSGGGDAPEQPAARVAFRDPDVALRAATGRLDSLAAPALGEVSVRGRVPLAETVGYLADQAAAAVPFAP